MQSKTGKKTTNSKFLMHERKFLEFISFRVSFLIPQREKQRNSFENLFRPHKIQTTRSNRTESLSYTEICIGA